MEGRRTAWLGSKHRSSRDQSTKVAVTDSLSIRCGKLKISRAIAVNHALMLFDSRLIDGQRVAKLTANRSDIAAIHAVVFELIDAVAPDAVIADRGHQSRTTAKFHKAGSDICRRPSQPCGEDLGLLRLGARRIRKEIHSRPTDDHKIILRNAS